MVDFNYKLDNFLLPYIDKIKKPVILELGVQTGRSTKKFLELCNKNDGWLFSVDLDDCSNVSKDKKWKFLHTRDDNFEYIKSQIPKKIDVVFIDTLHEAKHVRNLFFEYYPLIKSGGYIFIDDISHLPYLKDAERNNFYCEINNKETFETLLSLYSKNYNNFELNFSFYSSGLAIIKKINENDLISTKDLPLRNNTIKNFLRILWKKFKGN